MARANELPGDDPASEATDADASRELDRPVQVDTESRRRYGHHTNWQRLVLLVNLLIVVVCVLGAIGLIVSKGQLDQAGKTNALQVATTVAAPNVTTTVDGKPAPSTVPTSAGETVPTTVAGTFPPLADPQALNFLVAGEPNNACVDPNSPWSNAGDPDRGVANLSDTIMVIRMDPVTQRVAVLSFPRDLWLPISGRGSSNRINTAYSNGDPTRLAQTIYDAFGIVVDHYIQIDFCAFKTLVDAVGGVAVPFDYPIRDPNVQLLIPEAGCHTFVGDEALAYVRSRKLEYQDANGEWRSDNGYDLGRVSRQQDFIRRVMKAALDKGVYNPSVAQALLKSMKEYVVTDTELNVSKMLQFAGAMKNVNPATLATYQIEARPTTISGNAVLEPRIGGDNMQAILAIFRGQAPLAEAPAQVFDTDPTTTSAASATTTTGATTTTVVVPEEVTFGIVPSKDKTC